MSFEPDAVTITVFCALFGLVTVLGFVAARWKRGDLDLLDEWGLGGRRFGTVITWFLLGGDLFTAYTFIAVPALVFAVGAGGFFALPYTIIVFPLVFLVMPRLWSVASKHRYVTGADYVKGRYGSRPLATAIAFTGLLATMPYIALQLVGIEVVIDGARHRRRPAADHRVRDPRRVHVHERPARAGDDRARQGHADLRDGDRGGRSTSRPSSAGSTTSSASAAQALPERDEPGR